MNTKTLTWTAPAMPVVSAAYVVPSHASARGKRGAIDQAARVATPAFGTGSLTWRPLT